MGFTCKVKEQKLLEQVCIVHSYNGMSLSDSKYGGVPCSTCYYVSLVSGVSIEHCLIPVFIN